MRTLTLILSLFLMLAMTLPSYGAQYLNRKLIQCDPIIYVIEPLEIVGGTLKLDQNYHNDYGDCTGAVPGPPFIIEMPVTIINELNPDNTVLNWCNLIIDNRFGAMGSLEIDIVDGAVLECEGFVEAYGQPGATIVFTGNGRVEFPYHGGPGSPDFTRDFSYCSINPGPFASGNFFEINGGHLTMDNCRFGPTDDHVGLYYGGGDGVINGYDVVLKDCYFDRTSMNVSVSPNRIGGARSVDIDGLRFDNCQFPYESPVSIGCLAITGGDVIIKNLRNISGSYNMHDWIVFGAYTDCIIRDSCTIQTSNDFPAVFLSNIIVDSNAVLSIEDGSVIQMRDPNVIHLYPGSKMIVDHSVITSYADKAHGIYQPGLSIDEPNDIYAWWGIDMDPRSNLELKNNSLIRWANGPISGEGNITIDHSIIEQSWGTMVQINSTSPCSLNVIGSTIHQELALGDGISYTMSIASTDSAAGYIVIDSTRVTQCGSDGIYLGGGQGRSLDIDWNVRITNSTISGNQGSGIFGNMGQPADSIIIMNNLFAGNGDNGLWLNDGGCDSMSVRVENNVAIGNGNIGLGVHTGSTDIIGNSSLYNSGTGIYYPYKPQRIGHVANNISAYNDSYGFYCYAKYGGIVPTVAHNIFWSNNGTDDDLSFRSDDFDVYTVAELQALGGVGLTNSELAPRVKSILKAPIRSHTYNEGKDQTGVYIGGNAFLDEQLRGLAVLPAQNDTTAWFYVLRNTDDSVFIAGDIRDAANNGDTMTFYDYHLKSSSPAIEFGDNDYVKTTYDIDGDDRIIDGDENETALVDAGGDEFNPDSSGTSIMVVGPKADTTLIPGETVFISWYAPEVDSVNIDYTYDIPLGEDPSTWIQIAHDYQSSMPFINWEVPSVQSYRCKVRISDAADPTNYNTSDMFHIKQLRLTRLTADSIYEFFTPSQHGWSCGNTESDMWPSSYWSRVNYQDGIDPYTGREYPTYDTAYPFGASYDNDFPSWPLWVETFNIEQCYNNTPAGLMYVLRAVNRWYDNSDLWYGSCVGLSTTALLTFGNTDLLEPRWGSLNLPETIHQLVINDNLRDFINVLQTSAYGLEQMPYHQNGYSVPIDTTMAAIRRQLSSNVRDDAAIVIGSQERKGMHAMTPYAILSDPSPSNVRVMVYDPDKPGDDNRYILVDTTTDTWSYSGYPNWGGAHNFFIYYPVKSVIDWPGLKKTGKLNGILDIDAVTDSMLEFLFTLNSDLTLYDSLGDSIGCNDSDFFITIADGAPILPWDVDSANPKGFLLPEQPYTGHISHPGDSIIKIGAYYDSLYVGYRRICTDTAETDNFQFADGLSLSNFDPAVKTIQLNIVNTLPDRERSMVAMDCSLGVNDTIAIQPLGDSGFYLPNYGESSQYHLWLRELSSTGEKIFYSRSVLIGDHQAHIITPNWSNFNSDSCQLFIDTNFDMIADDSFYLQADVIVDVEDDPNPILPFKFELSQNYPNPFNPVTTIEYGLPERSHVRIDVYNVLGQKVRTLVDRVTPAGSYTVSWDGTNSSGSPVATGVYLYRFQAAEHVETKKMLLLK